MTETSDVLYEKQGPIATITLNRPDRRNGLTQSVLGAVERFALEAEEDDDVRVVIVTGTGEHFSVGMDRSSQEGRNPRSRFPEAAWRNWTVGHLLQMAKPSIAAIDGTAAGGGLAYALECDIRIASDRARFSTSYLRTGLPVVDGLAVLLPAAIGTSRALELLYTSRVIDAQEAERIGLVSRVVPAEKLRDSVRELAEEIAAGPPIAQRLTKHLVTTAQRQAYEAHLPYQLYAMHVNRSMGRHDLDEGLSAFREKRKPLFKGLLRRKR
jgi:2-(1,2-epoxy-1,2-dihydrophenyl)acetyl-CoA isomerase